MLIGVKVMTRLQKSLAFELVTCGERAAKLPIQESLT